MNVVITKSIAKGEIKAPPSKSMAHRLLICSHFAGGSVVSGVEYSEDIKATKECLEALETGDELYCNESGSTLRFIIPICLLQDREITLKGTDRLFSRCLEVYEDICNKQNLYFKQTENSVTVKGKLKSGYFKVRGDISSQFISGLMFVLPSLEGESVIEISGKIESRPYIDMTLEALETFGICEKFEGNIITIKGNQKYMPQTVKVTGDYSNSAFLDAFNYLGGDVKVSGLDENSCQGDKIYKEYFESLEKGTPTLDVSDCPDLAPVLMALAAAKNGCKLTGTRRLKIKESDRGVAMKTELAKMGVSVTVNDNDIVVTGKVCTPKETLYGHNDHRIVMALSVLCSVTGGTIEGAEAVSKSYPDFFEKIKTLGIEANVNET